jgi:hypothetical protein
MTMETINDLFAQYSDLCGSAGPVATRDLLRSDFWLWCEEHGVEFSYAVSGQAYLSADDGPFSPDAQFAPEHEEG